MNLVKYMILLKTREPPQAFTKRPVAPYKKNVPIIEP